MSGSPVSDMVAEHCSIAMASVTGAEKPLLAATKILQRCASVRGKVLAIGNGGSAAMAQHFAAELTVSGDTSAPFAVALTTDAVALTAASNDFGFESSFRLMIGNAARSGDVLVAFSTSGSSRNVLAGMKCARDMRMDVVGFSRVGAGEFASLCDAFIPVSSSSTARIQEVHEVFMHVLVELLRSRDT